jgi:hypothetical protein
MNTENKVILSMILGVVIIFLAIILGEYTRDIVAIRLGYQQVSIVGSNRPVWQKP